MSKLLIRPGQNGGVSVSPESSGLTYVGFEAFRLAPGAQRDVELKRREVCVVVLSGTLDVKTAAGEWRAIGRRRSVFDGLPDSVYLPPTVGCVSLHASPTGAEVGLCFAPAEQGGSARRLPPEQITTQVRGSGAAAREVRDILMADQAAESLLVTEVLTPSGHWSSYPPHKHDRDALPDESRLEETYYHRIRPNHGFGLQRVYTADGGLDECVAFEDRDVVVVPHGYHTVSAPPGYDVYYLNVMAGPQRAWRVTNDPAHEWLLKSRL